MREDVYEYRTETDGNDANHFTTISIHFKRLGNYHCSWELIDIVVFEVLLVNSRTFGNDWFYFQQERWKNQVRTSWFLIKKSLDRFQEMGFVTIERRDPKKMNYYKVHYQKIINNLEMIYDFSNVPKESLIGVKGRLAVFYEWWKDHDFNSGLKPFLKNGTLQIDYDSSVLTLDHESEKWDEEPVEFSDDYILNHVSKS